MPDYTVNNCCFCLTLRVGCYLITFLCLLFDLVLCVTEAYKAITKSQYYVWIGVGFYLLNTLLDIMLYYGIKQEKRRLIWAWIWLNGIFLGLAIIFTILCVSLGWLSILMCFFSALVAVLKFYSILVVRSYAYNVQTQIDVLP